MACLIKSSSGMPYSIGTTLTDPHCGHLNFRRFRGCDMPGVCRKGVTGQRPQFAVIQVLKCPEASAIVASFAISLSWSATFVTAFISARL